MKKAEFVTIRPEGFIVNGQFWKELVFIVTGESQARKLWSTDNGEKHLTCFSSNGLKSHNGKSCNICPNLHACQLKLRIVFKLESIDCCLELPKTSYENYRIYTTELLGNGLNVKGVTTLAYVVDRGYWGEVCFSKNPIEHTPPDRIKGNSYT